MSPIAARTPVPTLIFILALVLALATPAQGQHVFGDYAVHHGTMLTERLDPEVANRYDIRRSDHRALITVSVRKRETEGPSRAVRAEVEVTGVNLSAQRRELTMKEADEGEAIYYLTDFRIDPPETVRFEVRVRPEGSDQTHVFEVSRTFHAD